jgi:hypothetical protein
MRTKQTRGHLRGYYLVKDGEWIEPPRRGFKEQCCDCGLIHRMNFRINAHGRIEIQCFRDARATAAVRKTFCFTKDDD